MKSPGSSIVILLCVFIGWIPVPPASAQMNLVPETAPPLPQPLADLSIVYNAIDQGFYAIGGEGASGQTDAVYVYHDGDTAWSQRAPIPQKLSLHDAAILSNGKIYIAGGMGTGGFSRKTYCYDTNDQSSIELARAPIAYGAYCLEAVDDDHIIRIGGSPLSGWPNPQNRVDCYTVSTNTWTECAPMNDARMWAGSVCVDGIIYVAGGVGSGRGLELKSFEKFNFQLNQWTRLADMPVPLAFTSLFYDSQRDLIYTHNGGTGENQMNLNQLLYLRFKDEWTKHAHASLTNHTYRGAGASNRICLYAGGFDTNGTRRGEVQRAKVSFYDPCIGMDILGIEDNFLRPGEELKLDLLIEPCEIPNERKNSWESPAADIYPVFCILDVFGEYFFAPQFNAFGYYSIDLTTGDQTLEVIPATTWPDVPGTVRGLYFYAAMTNQSMNWLFSNLDVVEFGWTDS